MFGLHRVTLPTVPAVTLAEAKDVLRVDHTDEDDLIDALVGAATRRLEERTRRAFLRQSWQLRFSSFPVAGVCLPKPPILSVQGVKYWPDAVSTILRGHGASLTVTASAASIDRVLTGATTCAVTESGFAFEDLALTVDTVGASSTSFTTNGSLSAGVYAVDWRADDTEVWSTFTDYDLQVHALPARLLPRDLPDVDTTQAEPWLARYLAGYANSSADFAAAAPDLVQAIKLLLGHLYENRGEARGTISDSSDAAIPRAVHALIEPHIVPLNL